MATISNTPRPGYVWDSTDNVWYPIGVGAHQHTNAADTPAVIPNAIVDAKGDLLTATADNTPARLAVGSNGETIVADSSTSTGLRYQSSIAAGKNAVINGGFDIWQRGTSVGGGGGIYSADRWYLIRSGFAAGATMSRQPTGDTTNLPNIQYCARIQRDSGNTSTASIGISQSFETINSIPYAGKTVTLSFYARKSSTFSGNLIGLVAAGTGIDQNVSLGYSGFSTPISITAGSGSPSLTTTWQRYTLSGTIPTTATEIAVAIDMTVSGTAGADDYVEVAGVQLELGSVATAFTRNGSTIQGELAACMRYYEKSYSQGVTPPTNTSYPGVVSFSLTSAPNNQTIGGVSFKVVKRVAPTVTTYSYTSSSNGVLSSSSGADQVAGSANVPAGPIGDSGFSIFNQSGTTLTLGGGAIVHYIASAEL